MSETEEMAKPVRPWQWPGEWFRDQSFWRDVGSRTLSGLIVLFFGYWAALLLGFIKSPDNFKNAFQVTAFVMIAVGTIVWNEKFPMKGMQSWLASRFTALAEFVRPAAVYLLAFAIHSAILLVIVLVGLLMLRLIFTAAAALLGIEATF